MTEEIFQTKPEAATTSRLPLILLGIAVLAVVLGGGGLYWVAKQRPDQPVDPTVGLVRAGTPEFDDYLKGPKIALTNVEKFESNNMVGYRYDVTCRIENLGPRPLRGVELRGFILDFENKVIAERIVHPVPLKQPTLAPGQSMPAQVMIDGIKDSGQVMDVRVEVRGLRFEK